MLLEGRSVVSHEVRDWKGAEGGLWGAGNVLFLEWVLVMQECSVCEIYQLYIHYIYIYILFCLYALV